MEVLRRFWNDDNAQDLAEYGLIAGLISVVTIASLQSVGGSYQTLWNQVKTVVGNAAG